MIDLLVRAPAHLISAYPLLFGRAIAGITGRYYLEIRGRVRRERSGCSKAEDEELTMV